MTNPVRDAVYTVTVPADLTASVLAACRAEAAAGIKRTPTPMMRVLPPVTAAAACVAVLGVALYLGGNTPDDLPVLPPVGNESTTTEVTEPTDTTADTTTTTTAVKPTQSTAPSKKPTSPSDNVLWADETCWVVSDSVDVDASYGPHAYYVYDKKCGKQLSSLLSDNESTKKIAIFAQAYGYESTLVNYDNINEKSIEEYQKAITERSLMMEKLKDLIYYDGDRLAYGLEGSLDSRYSTWERFTKEEYKSRYKKYGKELLSKYIVDNTFLVDQAKADLEAARNDHTLSDACNQARIKYRQCAVAQLKKRLEQLGFDCVYTDGAESVLFYATEEEFASLSLGDAENKHWIFEWASEPMPMLGNGREDSLFVYKGKTAEEYYREYLVYTNLEGKYNNLVTEDGEVLKPGKDAYLTTDPNGDPWLDVCGQPFTKQTYDRYVDYYGEEMLSKYIVDGEFLKEKAKSDWKAVKKAEKEALEMHEKALAASQKSATAELKKKLEKLGYKCTYTENKTKVLFYITAQDYASLSYEVTRNCSFIWESEANKTYGYDLCVVD